MNARLGVNASDNKPAIALDKFSHADPAVVSSDNHCPWAESGQETVGGDDRFSCWRGHCLKPLYSQPLKVPILIQSELSL